MAKAPTSRDWATTEEVVAAAGVRAKSTVFLWAQRGVLPEFSIAERGKHGRMARWPKHAPAQARWVAALVNEGFTWEEIRAKLAGGEFEKSQSETGDEP